MSTKKAIQVLQQLIGEKLSLANLLRSIRMGEGMTQAEFAEKLGISKQYLCDIEHQRRFVSPDVAHEFAIKLGYSPDQFVKLCLQDQKAPS